jgi:hypothetical protein
MDTKTQNPIVITTSIFVGLVVIYAVLLFAASGQQDALTQTILISLGGAIFGSGLTFFLIRMTGGSK